MKKQKVNFHNSSPTTNPQYESLEICGTKQYEKLKY